MFINCYLRLYGSYKTGRYFIHAEISFKQLLQPVKYLLYKEFATVRICDFIIALHLVPNIYLDI